MALSSNRLTPWIGGPNQPLPEYFDYSMKGGIHVYAGALMFMDPTSGLVNIGTNALKGWVAVGRANEEVDATLLADGVGKVRIYSGAFGFKNSTAGDAITENAFGKVVYAVDDEVVALTSGGGARAIAGRMWGIDENGRVLVFVHPLVVDSILSSSAATPAGAGTVQSGTLTLVAGTKTINTGVTITASSKIVVTQNTPGGATEGVKYSVPAASRVVGAPGTGAFVVNAVDATGTLVNTDTSTLDYIIVG